MFICGLLFAQRIFLCMFFMFWSLEKKELGIGIGNALKKYSNLGRVAIFKIEALPNQEKSSGVHFCRSLDI